MRCCSLVLALMGALAAPSQTPLGAAAPMVERYEVYAAFTINLIRFITWPDDAFPSSDAPFIIGTFPRDPINDELDAAVQGEVVDRRPLKTRRIQSLDDLAQCHVVFMSKNTARQATVLSRVADKPVLTVSDAEGFLELGGHVRFVSQPPHTRLRISAEGLKSCRLAPRAQLLRIAAAP